MSTNKGCAPGKSSLIGLGSGRDYDGCAILQVSFNNMFNFPSCLQTSGGL